MQKEGSIMIQKEGGARYKKVSNYQQRKDSNELSGSITPLLIQPIDTSKTAKKAKPNRSLHTNSESRPNSAEVDRYKRFREFQASKRRKSRLGTNDHSFVNTSQNDTIAAQTPIEIVKEEAYNVLYTDEDDLQMLKAIEKGL